MIHFKQKLAALLSVAVLLGSSSALFAEEIADPLTGRVGAIPDSGEALKLRVGSGDVDTGRTKSQLCQGCHGEKGISIDPLIPKLAGQYDKYIAKQLRNYQAGIRTHQIMNAMAATINDEELADISSYFASQPRMKGKGQATNELGKNLFLKGNLSKMVVACVNCHGVNGKGLTPNTSMFPVIGGQHKEYLIKTLNDFKKDDRFNSPNAIMNRIVRSLSDAELEALADYVSEL